MVFRICLDYFFWTGGYYLLRSFNILALATTETSGLVLLILNIFSSFSCNKHVFVIFLFVIAEIFAYTYMMWLNMLFDI